MNNKKTIVLSFFFLSMGIFSCGQKINLGQVVGTVLGGQGGGVSTNEIGAGLKEALEIGVSSSSNLASQLDGYYKNPRLKIPLPAEIQNVGNTLRKIGLGGEVDKFELALNRGAEQAAQQAKPIFIAAVKQMTISDAISILRGDKDAATQYLKRTTSQELFKAFSPIVQKALTATEATKYYTSIASSYNKLPLVKPIQADLNQYATNKAMDGLFLLIADEEAKIRENPLARTTDLLKRVFGSQK